MLVTSSIERSLYDSISNALSNSRPNALPNSLPNSLLNFLPNSLNSINLLFSTRISVSPPVARESFPPLGRGRLAGPPPPADRPPPPNAAKALSDREPAVTAIVEPAEASATVQKYRGNMKIWPRKWNGGYRGSWLLGLPAAITFPRPDWFLRADYPTYLERHNCSPESGEFNAFKIMEKYRGLT